MNGFRKTRENAGLSQGEVAQKLGVTTAAISYWETGRMLPRASMLVKILDLYGCKIEDLFGPTDRK